MDSEKTTPQEEIKETPENLPEETAEEEKPAEEISPETLGKTEENEPEIKASETTETENKALLEAVEESDESSAAEPEKPDISAEPASEEEAEEAEEDKSVEAAADSDASSETEEAPGQVKDESEEPELTETSEEQDTESESEVEAGSMTSDASADAEGASGEIDVSEKESESEEREEETSAKLESEDEKEKGEATEVKIESKDVNGAKDETAEPKAKEPEERKGRPRESGRRRRKERFVEKKKTLKPGLIVKGREIDGIVSRIEEEKVYVSLDRKREGWIDKSELSEDGELSINVGDKVHAYILRTKPGDIKLSREKAREREADLFLRDAYENGIPVVGEIESRNKGGFDVRVMGRRAFLPISQIDTGFIENPDEYVGKFFRFKIIELSQRGKNIVISRAALLKEHAMKQAAETLAHLEAGDVVQGVVTSTQDFGAFVDIGGIEGLVHISELSWRHVEHPEEIVKPGDEVEVKILSVQAKEEKNKRISLSIREAKGDPWTRIEEELHIRETREGRVVRLAPFGAFVELLPGVDGLVHVSEMSWIKRIQHPEEVVQVGDIVRVTIQSMDPRNRRIALTMKDVTEDPWQDAGTRYSEGKIVQGRVEKVANFGVFVNFEPGITGLIPRSELETIGNETFRKYPTGKRVQVQVIAIDENERRLTLSRRKVIEKETKARMAKSKKRYKEPKPVSGGPDKPDGALMTLGHILKKKLEEKNADNRS